MLEGEQAVAVGGRCLLLRDGLLERAQEVAARDDADDAPVPDHGHAARVRLAHEALELGERGVLGAGDDGRGHDALHRRVGEVVAHRLVEILARDGAREVLLVADEDSALAMALALDHRVRDGVVRRRSAAGAT